MMLSQWLLMMLSQWRSWLLLDWLVSTDCVVDIGSCACCISWYTQEQLQASEQLPTSIEHARITGAQASLFTTIVSNAKQSAATTGKNGSIF